MVRSGTVLWQQLWLGLVKAAVLGALGEAAAGLHGPARGHGPPGARSRSCEERQGWLGFPTQRHGNVRLQQGGRSRDVTGSAARIQHCLLQSLCNLCFLMIGK